ncbi:MAG: SDR family NAD(P)-dependent oxidoreductase [Proteobacteria bacterium]|nr:SDR family NAD(P)-dependent oxidoreductase [Pseudomonadota bacterium]
MPEHSRRSILVTGCSSGIGHVAARELSARGYRVFATARKDEDIAALVADGLHGLRLDLDDAAGITAALDTLFAQTGGELYGLVNNAAFAVPGAVEDLDRNAIRAQFETNVFGTLDLTRQVLPAMRRQGYGRIVMISSILGLVAMPWRGAYNASKFALEGFTDTLRMELHGSGISVSTINPGAIETRFRKNAVRAAETHVDLLGTRHRERYDQLRRLAEDSSGRMPGSVPPLKVVRPLIHALESPGPRARYLVTGGARLLYLLKFLLPARLLDTVLRRL